MTSKEDRSVYGLQKRSNTRPVGRADRWTANVPSRKVRYFFSQQPMPENNTAASWNEAAVD